MTVTIVAATLVAGENQFVMLGESPFIFRLHCCYSVTQIKAARSLKRLLTGRLSSAVSSYPVFPGNEANFLRAQVGRPPLSATCHSVGC